MLSAGSPQLERNADCPADYFDEIKAAIISIITDTTEYLIPAVISAYLRDIDVCIV